MVHDMSWRKSKARSRQKARQREDDRNKKRSDKLRGEQAFDVATVMSTAFVHKSPRDDAGRVYGHDRTMHRNEELNVEVNGHGKVVAVWFRCQSLPFEQSDVSTTRSNEMRGMYANGHTPRLVAVHVVDHKQRERVR